MRLGDAAADGQAEPGAALVARVGSVDLLEALEDRLQLVLRNAAPFVAHGHDVRVVGHAPGDVDGGVGRRELDGVADQIDHRLQNAVGIDEQLRRRGVDEDLHAGAVGHRLHRFAGLLQQLGDWHRLSMQLHAARVHLLQVEDVVDQPAEAIGVGERDVEHALPFGRRIAEQAGAEEPDGAADGGQRRAQFVADGGDEFVFHPLDGQPLADVAEGDDDAGRGTEGVDDGAGGVFDRDRDIVDAQEVAAAGADARVEPGAADAALIEGQLPIGAGRGMNAVMKAAADEARRFGAEDSGRGGVHERDDAGEVEAEDAFSRRIEDGVGALHGRAQFLGARQHLAFQVDLVGLQRFVALADFPQHGIERLLHRRQLVVVRVRPLGHAHREVLVAAHALRGAGEIAQRTADQLLQSGRHHQRQQQCHHQDDRAGGGLHAHSAAHFAQVGGEDERTDVLVAVDDGLRNDHVVLVLRSLLPLSIRREHAAGMVENGAGDGRWMRAYAGDDLGSRLHVVEHHGGVAFGGDHRGEHSQVIERAAAEADVVVEDERAACHGQRAGGGQHDDGADLLADGKIAQRLHRTGPTMRARLNPLDCSAMACGKSSRPASSMIID